MPVFYLFRILLLLLFVFLVNIISAIPVDSNKQQEAKTKLALYVGNMENFNRYFPQEKVYLHFDNTGYFMGETMWFKAYVVRADTRQQTDLSEVLYVELLNSIGDVIQTQKLHIKNGQADGCIKLKDLFTSGFYEVRAYTRYMLNWDAAYAFSRIFPIFKAPTKEGDYSKKVIDKQEYRKRLPSNRITENTNEHRVNVRFYPEGGNLVKGINSRIAFEILDENGVGIDTTAVLNNGEDTVNNIRTFYEGRGVFAYTPSDTTVSMAVMGKTVILPKATTEGVVMSVRQDEKKLSVNISRSYSNSQTFGLVIVNGGNVDAFETLCFGDNVKQNACFFNRQDINEGVNQMVLIDSAGNVLSERLFFIYPTNQDSISITASLGSVLKPYGKLSFIAKTLPKSSFSISVKDWGSETNGNYQDAATWLLLSSDLKGYIHNPNYYLEKDDNEHRQAVDLLMMTQGWRKYDILQMEGKKTFYKSHPIEDRLYIYGQIKAIKKKQNVKGINFKVTLYNSLGQVLKGTAKTDSAGYYAFRLPDCEGEWYTLFSTSNDGKYQDYRVLVDRQFSPKARCYSFYEQQFLPKSNPVIIDWNEDDEVLKKVSMDKRNHLLREIKVKGHGLFENARAGWESEKRGAYRAILRYDMTKEVDAMADKGIEAESIFEFLSSKNKFFDGSIENRDDIDIAEPMDNSIESIIQIPTSADMKPRKSAPPRRMSSEGQTYKNRPIIWILNNCYSCATGVPNFAMQQTEGQVGAIIYQESHENIPDDLEDFKSVYISEDDNIWKRYAYFPALATLNPVTVFLYTYHETYAKQRGIRHTNFVGFSKIQTFEMPDYSQIPPMPDYRRTLYWNPNVTTDKNGEAKIEFYNNSTCRQLVISAEGITKDGRAIVYRQ